MPLLDRLSAGAVAGYRVGRYGGLTNSGVWFYRVGRTLFDCGCPNQRRVVKDIAVREGVTKVVVSHHHEDHAGNANVLSRDVGAAVLAAPAAAARMRSGYTIEYYRQLVWGTMPPAPLTRAFSDDDYTEGIPVDGTDGWRAFPIPAPGHCSDHHVIHLLPANGEPGALFGADLFVTSRPRIARFDQDPVQEMASLRRVLGLDFDALYCAHKGRVPDGKRALQARLDFLLGLRAAVRAAVRSGDRDVAALTRRLLGPASFFEHFTLHDFSRRHMIASLVQDCDRGGGSSDGGSGDGSSDGGSGDSARRPEG